MILEDVKKYKELNYTRYCIVQCIHTGMLGIAEYTKEGYVSVVPILYRSAETEYRRVGTDYDDTDLYDVRVILETDLDDTTHYFFCSYNGNTEYGEVELYKDMFSYVPFEELIKDFKDIRDEWDRTFD